MKKEKLYTNRDGVVAMALLATLIFSGDAMASSSRTITDTNPTFSIDDEGQLARPQNYRSWIYVGTPVTPNELNNGKAAFPEFHNVYIDPASYEHWKQTGTWRDGTILIKELVSVGKKKAVSGKGYFMGDFIGLEATIKSKQHFPDEPGNWAYFSFTNPEGSNLKDQVKPFETASCNTCHEQSATDDFVFTQYYPVLRAAKGFGMGNPEAEAARGPAGEDQPMKAPEKKTSSLWKPSAPTPENVNSEVPVNQEALFSYLASAAYKTLPAKESKAHPSESPHTKVGLPVRVFMNERVAQSLEAGNTEHPVGSALIKEMFSKDNELAGWAVAIKTQPLTDGGKGWFWYEVTSATDSSEIVTVGNGVRGCVGCHTPGDDMVLSAFPLL
jgi:hypothetical protein